MEAVGLALMRSIARGLHLPETIFDASFEGGISTLRLIRYPLRDAAAAQFTRSLAQVADWAGELRLNA